MHQIIVFYYNKNSAKKEASAAALLNEQGELATLKIIKAAEVTKINK